MSRASRGDTPIDGIVVPGTSAAGASIQRASVGPVRQMARDVAAATEGIERRREAGARRRHLRDRMAAAALVLREQFASARQLSRGRIAVRKRRGPERG
ncbi:hypothetical protein [Variovorax sp. UC122_21]|uniref:hypothetical protein n=1 Tax=Variovorax sp. UC122_21 TaxID=3374554 RepID=UPI003758275A